MNLQERLTSEGTKRGVGGLLNDGEDKYLAKQI